MLYILSNFSLIELIKIDNNCFSENCIRSESKKLNFLVHFISFLRNKGFDLLFHYIMLYYDEINFNVFNL